MSDFDKEAEREKLRERFAEEEPKRETTERMSELLLQGATMTNTHCNNCGDPLFRYDGQTFCPTCQTTVESEPEETPATTDDTRTDDEPTPERTMDEGQQIAVNDPRDDQPADQTRRTTTPEDRQPEPSRGRRAPPSQTADTGSDEHRSSSASRSAGSADDLAATEASISRTLSELASTAEETDDLGRTRDHLAAAREAAEALEAVREARC
jgi:uncharacterized Zn finger protein (UPF0148 family)